MAQADKVIAAAEKWLGYLEKQSNAHLSELTANAGDANYTIFAEKYKTLWNENYQAQPWCAVFVSCMLYEGCGKETVKHFAYCPFGVNWFKQQGQWYTSGPKRGDVIFFKDSSGTACHVGLVADVNGSTITTIEGNTSSASGVVANGGCVRKKTYDTGYSRILGYGRPAYQEDCQEGRNGMNILLIAGHGGSQPYSKVYDPGACGCGEQEAELTRELAYLVGSELKNVKGVTPLIYDRGNNAYDVLKNGGTLPLTDINYVLEIHFNAGVNDAQGNGSTTGVEVLVHTLESGVGVEDAICKRVSALGFKNRGVKRRSDLLVMNTVKKGHNISHALIETCFIDDADDMKLYKSIRPQVAKAIAQGIAEGFGLQYTVAPVTSAEPEKAAGMTKTEIQALVADTVNKMDVPTTAKNAAKTVYEHENPLYTDVDQVPDYWRTEVKELINMGAVRGNGTHEISIRHETLQAAVIALRVANQN